jgi:hypothetical protein
MLNNCKIFLLITLTAIQFSCGNKITVYGYINLPEAHVKDMLKGGKELPLTVSNSFFVKNKNSYQFYYHNIEQEGYDLGIEYPPEYWDCVLNYSEDKDSNDYISWLYAKDTCDNIIGGLPSFNPKRHKWEYEYDFYVSWKYSVNLTENTLVLKKEYDSELDTIGIYPLQRGKILEYILDKYKIKSEKLQDTVFGSLQAVKYYVKFYEKNTGLLYATRFDYLEKNTNLPIHYNYMNSKIFDDMTCPQCVDGKYERIGITREIPTLYTYAIHISPFYKGELRKTKISKEIIEQKDFRRKPLHSDSLKQVYKIKPK